MEPRRTTEQALVAVIQKARLNKEVKRRADVVGLLPDEDAIKRLVGAMLMEQNDEWQLQHRHMSLETRVGSGDEPSTALLRAS